jgi:hypothetical protein
MTQFAEQQHATADELAAYAVGGDLVEAAIASHIATCAQCGEEANAIHLLEARLYRIECPDLPELESYVAGQVPLTRRVEMERHLRTCGRCESDLATLRRVITVAAAAPAVEHASTDPLPAATLGEQAREALRRVLAALVPSPPTAALGLRGAEATYRADTFDLKLGSERQGITFNLSGKIIDRPVGEAGGAEEPPHAISARLLKSSDPDTAPTLVSEVPISRRYFEFLGVYSGRYQIEILLPDRLVVIASIVL